VNDRLDIGPILAMRSPAFSYVRIDARGFFSPAELAAALSDPRLAAWLRETGLRAVALNASLAQRIGTEDTEWLATQWAPMLARVGISKLSLITPDHVHQLFGAVFQAAARRAAEHRIELRCFPSAQFTQSFESVSWFDAPVVQQAAPVPASAPAPVVTRGRLELDVPTDHWPGVFVSAAFGGILGGAACMSVWGRALRELGIPVELSPFLGVALGLVLSLAGTFLVLLLRGWPRTSVEWDEHTVTEKVGDTVRTVIERAKARRVVAFTKVLVRRRGAANRMDQGGRVLQLTDDAGNEITLAEGAFAPPWMSNQPCKVSSIQPLFTWAPVLTDGDAIPGDRATRRMPALVFGFISLLSYGALAAGVIVERDFSLRGTVMGPLVLVVAVTLMLVRTLWPLTACFRKRPGGRLSAMTEVALRCGAAMAIGLPAAALFANLLLESAFRPY
jgi:hypothetical protein